MAIWKTIIDKSQKPMYWTMFQCPYCNMKWEYGKTPYCPWCGSKVEKEEKKDD